MTDQRREPPIGDPIYDKFRDTEGMLQVFIKATHAALLSHAQAGRSVPIWRDEQVYHMTPAEIFRMLDELPPREKSFAEEAKRLAEQEKAAESKS